MKKLEIKLKEYTGPCNILCTGEEKITISVDEYPHIYDRAYDMLAPLDEDDFQDALDVIITYMMQHELYRTEVNLDERNESYAPIKEMTIDEIEKAIGCKVKIVKKKEGK